MRRQPVWLGANAGFFLAVALAVALVTLWRSGRAAAPPAGMGVLEIAVVDDGTGKPTPARLEIVGPDGRPYAADDALPVGGDCRDREAPWADAAAEAKAILSPTIRNRYTGKTDFYSAGSSRAVLAAGRYQLMAWKGIEYRASSQTVDISEGKTSKATVKLSRWIDMTAEAWWSADTHLHVPRTTEERNPVIAKWMQAEDIHVASLLQWGHSRRFINSGQYAFGVRGLYRDGTTLLAAGQENPRTHILGHVIL